MDSVSHSPNDRTGNGRSPVERLLPMNLARRASQMLKRLAWFVVLISALGNHVSTNAATLGATSASTSASATVVEFYHAGLDHFFITADDTEIAALDSGAFKGWARTGYSFTAFTAASWNASRSPVCRFYGRPQAGLESHFYSGAP